MVFVNCTHHAVKSWPPEQVSAAQEYGDIMEIPFPNVPATATAGDVHKMACDLLDRFVHMAVARGDATVHLMGEHTLCGALMREYERRSAAELGGGLTSDPVYVDHLRFVVTANEREATYENGRRRFNWRFVAFREVL